MKLLFIRVHTYVGLALSASLLPGDCRCKLIINCHLKEDFQGYMAQACVLTESFCIFWNYWFGLFLKTREGSQQAVW